MSVALPGAAAMSGVIMSACICLDICAMSPAAGDCATACAGVTPYHSRSHDVSSAISLAWVG